jgi:cell fate regulator YaaT (PSP1 superfamily)
LIRAYSSEFRLRIQMWQIGERQEAGRLGGIGSCGRELCCSTWLTDFRSVSTTAARYQQLALNPVKLAGQCGKLKCCLNYELDSYMDALKDFPQTMDLDSVKGRAVHQKTDIFKKTIWYTYLDAPENFIPLSVERVKAIIDMNQKGKKPETIEDMKLELMKEKEVGYVVGGPKQPRSNNNRNRNNRRRRDN